jgi:hypothetical protein
MVGILQQHIIFASNYMDFAVEVSERGFKEKCECKEYLVFILVLTKVIMPQKSI